MKLRNRKSALVATVSFFSFLVCAFALILEFEVTSQQTQIGEGWIGWAWAALILAVIFMVSTAFSIGNYLECKRKKRRDCDKCDLL